MSTAAVYLLDKVKSILETEINSSSAFDITRAILPRSSKRKRDKPEIFVSLNGISSIEQSRSDLLMQYVVSVTLVQEANTETKQETALGNVELIASTLLKPEYKMLTTTEDSSQYCFQPPFTVDPIFDPDALNEQSVFLTVQQFNYVRLKGR
tara:strand:+ start:671 stop:1126 length:456 start_codon:yes stop_codon:yes gene_type:complete